MKQFERLSHKINRVHSFIDAFGNFKNSKLQYLENGTIFANAQAQTVTNQGMM